RALFLVCISSLTGPASASISEFLLLEGITYKTSLSLSLTHTHTHTHTHTQSPRIMAAPVFYTISSVQYQGYKLTQRGPQVVLEAEDSDNPFQVWYKDDWWRFTEDKAGNPAFALINNGSKAALKADADATPSHVLLLLRTSLTANHI
ncbi:hypothetical protein GOP47_0004476, partial [Adiantum capillus-veneris]